MRVHLLFCCDLVHRARRAGPFYCYLNTLIQKVQEVLDKNDVGLKHINLEINLTCNHIVMYPCHNNSIMELSLLHLHGECIHFLSSLFVMKDSKNMFSSFAYL